MVWVLVIISQIAGYLIADAIVSEPPKDKQQIYELKDFKITPECYRDEKERLICPRTKV